MSVPSISIRLIRMKQMIRTASLHHAFSASWSAVMCITCERIRGKISPHEEERLTSCVVNVLVSFKISTARLCDGKHQEYKFPETQRVRTPFVDRDSLAPPELLVADSSIDSNTLWPGPALRICFRAFRLRRAMR